MEELPISVCRVDTPEGTKDYVVCIPEEEACSRGLPPEATLGVLLRPLASGEHLTPSVFAPNRVFVEFMHEVIARRGPELPGLVASAQRQGTGWVYIIDQRTRTPAGPIPAEDIVGVFEVRDHALVGGSYRANPNHKLLSSGGFVRLERELQACLLDELATRCRS